VANKYLKQGTGKKSSNQIVKEDTNISEPTSPVNRKLTKKTTQKEKKIVALEKRRARNKKSAKSSREKKKDYIGSLEKRIEELEEENSRLKKEMKEYQSKEETKDPLQHQNKPATCSEMKVEFLAMIKETLAKPNSYSELGKIFEKMLTYKVEEEIKERAELNESFNKAIDTIIPACTKHVLADCMEKKGFFEIIQRFKHVNLKDDKEEMVRSLNFTTEQKLKAIQYGKMVSEEAQRIKLSLVDLLQVKRDIYQKILNLNKVMYDIKTLVTPEQMARIFLLKSNMMTREEQSLTTIFHLNYKDYEVPDDCSYYKEIISNHYPSIEHKKNMSPNVPRLKHFELKRGLRTSSRQVKEEQKSLEM